MSAPSFESPSSVVGDLAYFSRANDLNGGIDMLYDDADHEFGFVEHTLPQRLLAQQNH